MTPLGCSPPTNDLGGPAPDSAKVAAAVSMLVGVVAVWSAAEPRPTQLLSFMALFAFSAMPLSMLAAKWRRHVVLGTIVGGVAWGFCLIVARDGNEVLLSVLLLAWVAAALATFALIDAGAARDHVPLGPMSQVDPSVETGGRLRNVAAFVGGLAAVLLVLGLLARIPLPNLDRPESGSGSGSGKAGGSGGGSGGSVRRSGSERVNQHEYAEELELTSGDLDPFEVVFTYEGPTAWTVTELAGPAFDVWNGRTWTRSAASIEAVQGTSGFDGVDIRPPGVAPLDLTDPDDPSSRLEWFDITVVTDNVQVLFAPPTAVQVETESDVSVLDDGAVVFPDGLQPDDNYTVWVRRPSLAPLEAFPLEPTVVDAPEGIDALQLPDDVSDRVRDLAIELAVGAPGSFASIEAVRQWLFINTRRANPDTKIVQADDRVDAYLFGQQVATDPTIETAAVVLLRAGGVPARLGSGFRSGVFDAETGEHVVVAGDAAVWTEVWFGPDQGWVPFRLSASVKFALSGDSLDEPRGDPLSLPAWIPIVLLVGAALIGTGFALVARHRRRKRLAARPWPVRMLDDLEREGTKRGRGRRRSEPLRAYSDSLSDSVLPSRELASVGVALDHEVYSPYPPDPALRAEAERSFAVAVAEATRVGKLRKAAVRAARRQARRATWRRGLRRP